RDLRIAEQVVVEAERLAVDGEASPLAGPPPAVGIAAVPAVRITHVGAGAEYLAAPAQVDDLDRVVEREVVEVPAQLLAHRGVVAVAAVRVVERDPGDAGLVVAIEQHAAGSHECVLPLALALLYI